MATKTFEELKQLAIQIRDEKTNKQNTATRIGTQMLEHLNKLEQDYYDKTATDEELKQRDEKLTELSSIFINWQDRDYGAKYIDVPAIPNAKFIIYKESGIKTNFYRIECYDEYGKKMSEEECGINPNIEIEELVVPENKNIYKIRLIVFIDIDYKVYLVNISESVIESFRYSIENITKLFNSVTKIDSQLLISNWQDRDAGTKYIDIPAIPNAKFTPLLNGVENDFYRVECYNEYGKKMTEEECGINPNIEIEELVVPENENIYKIRVIKLKDKQLEVRVDNISVSFLNAIKNVSDKINNVKDSINEITNDRRVNDFISELYVKGLDESKEYYIRVQYSSDNRYKAVIYDEDETTLVYASYTDANGVKKLISEDPGNGISGYILFSGEKTESNIAWVSSKINLLRINLDRNPSIKAELIKGEGEVLTTIKMNGTKIQPDSDKSINLNLASNSKDGVMSKEDKAKLDSFTGFGTVTIEGSGVTKNASAFGFLPDKSGTENASKLTEAMKGGGTILIDYPGVYNIDGPVYIPSHTTLLFGNNVYLKKTGGGAVFMNEGALTRTYNENIAIIGLKLIVNGFTGSWHETLGLNGHLVFFYIKRLLIDDFEMTDGDSDTFCMQVCTFEDITIQNIHIEGRKDAVHLGRGKRFLIRNGVFKTYDDPIALNSFDYDISNPEVGNIEDGIIENCVDLDDVSTTGYFARMSAGGWVDWYQGMKIKKSDIVVSNGKMYRANVSADGQIYTSNTQPTHESGEQTLDGIKWVMFQTDVIYTCCVKNVYFKNIWLQKKRTDAFSIPLSNTDWSRSYYPNAQIPISENIFLEKIHVQNEITNLLRCSVPVTNIKISDSFLKKNTIIMTTYNEEGLSYPTSNILINNNIFDVDGEMTLIQTSGRKVRAKITASMYNEGFVAKVSGTDVIYNDMLAP